jgi:hypothetical protein
MTSLSAEATTIIERRNDEIVFFLRNGDEIKG